jgi:thiol-disulfide isomerase/thioredoxin
MTRRWVLPVGAALLALTVFTGAPARAEAPLAAVDGAKLKQTIARYRGKVVVLNFWATWCGPCVAELPELVRLQKGYGGRGVQVVLVSIDDMSARGTAARKLRSLGATATTNLIVANGQGEKTVRAILPDWQGAVPMTVVFSKSGKITDRMLGGREYSEFERVVKAAERSK